MRIWLDVRRRLFEPAIEAKALGEPAHNVATFTQGAADDKSPPIQAIDKGSPRNTEPWFFHDDAQRPGCPDRGTGPLGIDGSCADVGQSAVANRLIPGNLPQGRPAVSETRPQSTRGFIPIGQP